MRTPRTTLGRMSRYVLARSRHLLFPVSRILLDPPSREMSKVGVLPSDCLVHSSLPHTIVGVRTPYYENTSVRCRRLVGVARRRGAVRFYKLHSFTGRWWCVEKALHQISAGSRCPSFCCLLDVLTSHDIASNLHSSRQRTLPQSDITSFDQRGNRSGETTEQTSKPVPPLDTSAGKVGQCPTHLPRIVVVVIHLNSPELHR